MKNAITPLLMSFILFFSISGNSFGCTHTISLFDSYGDGWHGNNFVDVYVDGTLVLDDITLGSGSGPASYSFEANTGQSIQVTYTSGSWASECYFDITNNNGTVLADDWYPNTDGTTVTATCGSCTPYGDEVSYGNDSWIGYAYTSNGSGSFDTYLGYVSENEVFNRDMSTGNIQGLITAIPCNNISNDFSIRYKMNRDFPAGNYVFTLGGDDGVRLSIDGGSTWLISDWSDHSYRTTTSGSVYLDGSTNLVIEFYENGGHAHVSFDYTFTPDEGDNINDPIDLGLLACNDLISETFNTSYFSNTDENSSPDVFHSFTLSSDARVNINTCSDSDYDTYLRLYDSGQTQIQSNDDVCGLQSEIEQNLSAGTYYIMTEGYDSNSGTANLEVSIVPEAPAISSQPASTSICEGDNTSLSVASDCGACACTYQWQEYNGSWTDIAGETSDTFLASPTATTEYRCVVSNSGLNTTSNAATVTVNPYPTNVDAGADQMVCSSESVQLDGSADGTSVSFSWSPSASLDNAGVANPNASPSTGTLYTMTASINGCSVQDDVYVYIYDGNWSGIEDNNWHNPTNWCNGVPTSSDDVVISSNATNMPEIHMGAANVHNLTILSGASLDINNDQALNVYGDFLNQGNLTMANGDETIAMQGSNVNINSNGNSVNHLVIQGSSTVVNILNSFDILGDLDIQAGSLNLGAHTIQVSGDISVDGVLNPATSTVVLNGTTTQNLNTNGTNAAFNNLTINNSTDNLSEIVLHSDLHIAGHLTLNQGIVSTNAGAHIVKLLNGASSDNGNASSFIHGKTERTGSSAFTYPVGDVANIGGSNRAIWAPVETEACASSTISAEYHYDNPPYDWWYHGENMDASIDHVSDREYWNLTSDNAYPGVTIHWTDNNSDLHAFGATTGEMTAEFVAENLTIAHYNTNTGKWEDMGADLPAGSIYFDDGELSTTVPFPSYSPITFGSKNPDLSLPVELTGFSADCQGDNILFNWTTASETNNDFFSLEKSRDGETWELISTVKGAGNSQETQNYTKQISALNGKAYYRLSQTDFDGTHKIIAYSSTNCELAENKPIIEIYPNPFNSQFNMTLKNWPEGNVQITLTDMSGKRILKRETIFTAPVLSKHLSVPDIKAGMYILNVQGSEHLVHKKVQKW